MLRPLPWGVGKQGGRGDRIGAVNFLYQSATCYTKEGEALAKINLGGDPNMVVANAVAPTEENNTEDNNTGENNFVGAIAIAPGIFATNKPPITRMRKPDAVGCRMWGQKPGF